MADTQCIALNKTKTTRDGQPSRCTFKAVNGNLCSGHSECYEPFPLANVKLDVPHTENNDTLFDKDIEYEVKYYERNGIHMIINTVKYNTLYDLFTDLTHADGKLVFKDARIREQVRVGLNRTCKYEIYGIHITQIDKTLKEPLSIMDCTCPPGFRGSGAFCPYHRD